MKGLLLPHSQQEYCKAHTLTITVLLLLITKQLNHHNRNKITKTTNFEEIPVQPSLVSLAPRRTQCWCFPQSLQGEILVH